MVSVRSIKMWFQHKGIDFLITNVKEMKPVEMVHMLI